MTVNLRFLAAVRRNFCTVIDDVCVKIARHFYVELVQGGLQRMEASSIPGSLHAATRKVYDEYMEAPLLWAPHVHIGA